MLERIKIMPTVNELIRSKIERSPGRTLALAIEPLERIRTYGKVEIIQTPAGEHAILLPSRLVPDRYLDRSLWDRTVGMGNRRKVYSIDRLTTGEDPGLVVREAERVFTTNSLNLSLGNVWWDGPRSHDRPVAVHDPIVDVQTFWEAAILLELWSRGIPAEIPQALLVGSNGHVSLVVQRIDDMYARHQGQTHAEILRRVGRETALKPVDSTEYNTIRDRDGRVHLIDVNQWQWPPYTDGVKTALVDAVKSAIIERV